MVSEEPGTQPIQNLCKHFNDLETTQNKVPNIIFNDGGMFEALPSQEQFPVNEEQSPVNQKPFSTTSLATLLKRHVLVGGNLFPTAAKASLALSLGRCLLHLFLSSWMRDEWTADTIHFLYKQTGPGERIFNIRLPYITCTLSEWYRYCGIHSSSTRRADPFKCDLKGDDVARLKASHCHRFLWAFAGLLLEIETGKVVNLKVSEETLILRDKVWEELIQLETNSHKSDELAHYIQAIQGCVSFTKDLAKPTSGTTIATKKVKEPGALENVTYTLHDVRRVIYNQVVKNLENHYSCFSDETDNSHAEGLLLPVEETAEDSTQSSYDRCTFNSQLIGKIDNLKTTVENAKEFWRRFKQFRRRFMEPKMTTECRGSRPRIKIALLDTGICEAGTDFENQVGEVMDYRKEQGARDKDEWNPIKIQRSFVEGDRLMLDSCGHGTHLACLLLKYAPDADLYIAKISSNMDFEVTDRVADAIKWAAGSEVGADIIVMSFGLMAYSKTIDNAIEDAVEPPKVGGHRPLIFAAASNHGLSEKRRSYPGRDSKVIGVYTLDGLGISAGIPNPPLMDDRFNFGTLGAGIDIKWDEEDDFASGSSYSTPILAAITANYLDWLGHHKTTLGIAKYELLRKRNGFEQVLKSSMSANAEPSTRMLFVAPWLWLAYEYDLAEKNPLTPELKEVDAETEHAAVIKIKDLAK